MIQDLRRLFGGKIFVLAAVMVLALAACGRKGALEPPPSATAVQGEGETEAVEAPQPPRKFFLDFLL